jgi:hypothetical protein
MNDFDQLETLLGLPKGSTESNKEALSKGVKKKTKELGDTLKLTTALDTMSKSDIVKSGFDIDLLEQDKVRIREEAFWLHDICKELMEKFMNDARDQIDMNDRMYASGAKIIDSLSSSLKNLTDMTLKFKQEEQFKQLNMVTDEDTGSKEMSPEQFNDWVERSKKNSIANNPNVQDAELVDPKE